MIFPANRLQLLSGNEASKLSYLHLSLSKDFMSII